MLMYMTEAFESSMGTQRSDIGMWKRFSLNLTTVALPNLIGPDLVITHPMTSTYGYVTYLNYEFGVTKGGITQGDYYNGPFALGDVDSTYTSNSVVESAAAGTGAQALAWTTNGDIVHGAFPVDVGGVIVNYDIKLVKAGEDDIYGFYNKADKKFYEDFDGVSTYTNQITVDTDTKVAYLYDNVVIPQSTLPTLKARFDKIALEAHARRIAIYYSQIAMFQAKTDYGVDLADQLAEQAVGELAYEIDTEICELLSTTAGAPKSDLVWSKTLPVGVSKAEHYEGFTEIVENARRDIYKATKKFAPNYMLISADVLPVLTFIKGFTAAPAGQINGPYFAGTLNGLKVYVAPSMGEGEFCIGVNGSDMMSSVAVYAPYMAIIPTMLIQGPDGGTTQGWSTLYDLKVLNPRLIVKGKVVA